MFASRRVLRSGFRLDRDLSSSSSVRSHNYDVCIIGGGIVGLATAQELSYRHPQFKIGLIEKESDLAQHQTGHNSGVIHAGIYYKPGSLMAKLCVEGLHSTYAYCDFHKIPYKKVGKLVVATNELEVSRLGDLYERAKQNKVPGMKMLNSQEEIQVNQLETFLKAPIHLLVFFFRPSSPTVPASRQFGHQKLESLIGEESQGIDKIFRIPETR